MIKYIFTVIFLLLSTGFFSQETEPSTVIYDVVHLKEGGSIKGEILSFDEASGGLVFKDYDGRTYSFGREDYAYFKENQVFPVKQRGLNLRARKNNEYSLQVGFGLHFLVFRPYFANNRFVLNQNDYYETPLTLKVAAGKFFDEKNFGAINLDYGIAGDAERFYNVGLRYNHYYDSRKRNLGLYIPVEFQYAAIRGQSFIQVFDSFGAPPIFYADPVVEYEALTLSIGHGFSAMMSDKKYLSIEFAILTQFGLEEDYFTGIELIPDRKFDGTGWKVGVLFGF